MSEMYLWQPRFKHRACRLFTKNKMRTQNSKQQKIPGMSIEMNYTRSVFSMIWQMEISKIYQEERRLTKCYVVWHSKLLLIKEWFSWVAYKFFGKKARDTNTKTGTGTYESQELTNKLHKSITRDLEGCKVYSSYRTNISEIQFLSKYNKRFRFVQHVIDI